MTSPTTAALSVGEMKVIVRIAHKGKRMKGKKYLAITIS